MSRNILKFTSMLFVGLALATACSGDKNEDSALKVAVNKAKEVEKAIGAFVVTELKYNDQAKVYTEASTLFKDVKTQVEASKSEANDKAKAELEKALGFINDYNAAKATSAAAEKIAAEKVAKEVREALEEAVRVS